MPNYSFNSVQCTCNYSMCCVHSGFKLKVERTASLLSYILDIFISVVSLPSIYQWIVRPKKKFPLQLIPLEGKTKAKQGYDFILGCSLHCLTQTRYF